MIEQKKASKIIYDTTSPSVAGIHVTGSQTRKTAVTLIRLDADSPNSINNSGVLENNYEKIGPLDGATSNDRLIRLLSLHGPFSQIFLSCPLSLPVCVRCSRDLCPGNLKCEDIYLNSFMSVKHEASKQSNCSKKRRKSLNPVHHRLWDAYLIAQNLAYFGPSFNSNNASIAMRAQKLKKQIKQIDSAVLLKETHVGYAIESCVRTSLERNPPQRLGNLYKCFDRGKEIRKFIFEELTSHTNLRYTQETKEQIVLNADNFTSFVCAWIASISAQGRVDEPLHQGFNQEESWVYRPKIVPFISREFNS